MNHLLLPLIHMLAALKIPIEIFVVILIFHNPWTLFQLSVHQYFKERIHLWNNLLSGILWLDHHETRFTDRSKWYFLLVILIPFCI